MSTFSGQGNSQGNGRHSIPSKVLTVKSVEGAKPDHSARREIADGALPGFYLVVQPSGAKSWALRYRFEGKPKKLTVGPVLLERLGGEASTLPLGTPMTLTEARRAARDALQMIAEGRDPAATKKAVKVASKAVEDVDKDTVAKHGERFVERYCKPRNRTWKETERQFKKEINPHWGTRKIDSITKRDVIDLLDAIVDRGTPVGANRTLAVLRKFFGWLVGRDVLQLSPCGGIKLPTKESSRDRVLTDDEIRVFWKAVEGFEYPFGPIFRLLLLTGQRRSEVAGLKWNEITLGNECVWILPAARAKNKREHLIPLPSSTVKIMESLPKIRGKGFVFTTTGETAVSGYSRAKDRLDAAMLSIMKKEAEESGNDPEKITLEHWTFHDLRRTMASKMASLNISLPVIEKVLNHVSGSFGGIVGVYQRHDFRDEKRTALEAWANYLDALVTGKADNVLPFRAAQ